MALTKKEKVVLAGNYKETVSGVKNIVMLKQFSIPVNEVNKVRMELEKSGGRLTVVKKRIFLNNVKNSGFNGGELDSLEGSVAALYAYEDEFAPLKVVSKIMKDWKKKKVQYGFEYLGGWFNNDWKDSNYVKQLADMPSKEELVGKFMFMMNYPVQSFVQVLDQIAKKKGE